MMKIYALLFLALLSPCYGEGNYSSVAEKQIKQLSSSSDLKTLSLAISKNIAPRYKKVIEESLLQWRSERLSDQKEYKVLGSKQVGSAAVVMVGSVDTTHPTLAKVHPLCLVRNDGVWRMAPMVSSFQYADIGFDLELRKDISSLNEWKKKAWETSYDKHKAATQKAFAKKLSAVKAEMRKKCKTHEQVLEFLFEQVDKKSLEGVCAAIGLDATKRVSEGQYRSNDLIVASINKAFSTRGGNIGAWASLQNKDLHRINLLTKNVKGRNAKIAKNIGVALLDPSRREGYQFTVFEICYSEKKHYVRLPDGLIMNSLDQPRFYNSNFEKWSLNGDFRKAFDEVPHLLFKRWKAEPLNKVEDFYSNFSTHLQKKNFYAWLKLHTPKDAMDEKTAIDHYKELMEQWKSKLRNYPAVLQKVEYSEDKKYGHAVFLALNYKSISNSEKYLHTFVKDGKAWKFTILNEEMLKKNKELNAFAENGKKLLNAGADNFADGFKQSMKEVDWAKVTKLKGGKKAYEKTVKQYLKSIEEGDFMKAVRHTCYFPKTKINLNNLGVEIKSAQAKNPSKVQNVIFDGEGLGLVCIESELNGGLKFHNVYTVINVEGGPKVDLQHQLSISENARNNQLTNKRIWKKILKQYGKDRCDFLQKAHKQLVKELEPDEFEF